MKANDRYCRSDGCPQSLLRLASTARLDHLVVIFFFFFSRTWWSRTTWWCELLLLLVFIYIYIITIYLERLIGSQPKPAADYTWEEFRDAGHAPRKLLIRSFHVPQVYIYYFHMWVYVYIYIYYTPSLMSSMVQKWHISFLEEVNNLLVESRRRRFKKKETKLKFCLMDQIANNKTYPLFSFWWIIVCE